MAQKVFATWSGARGHVSVDAAGESQENFSNWTCLKLKERLSLGSQGRNLPDR